MTLLKGQADVSAPVPMPVDNSDQASTVGTSSSETLTWFYVSTGAWASATTQAAGTLVFGKLTYKGVLNSNNAAVGSYNNTSFSLAASTRLDTLVSIPDEVLSKMQFMSPTDQKATALVYLTTNGYYAIDHRRGQVWGRPKATVADDTVTYTYFSPVGGAPSSMTPGTGATNLGKAEDAAHASGDVGVFALGVANEAQTSLAADGDYIAQATDTKGNRLVIGNLAHDAVDAGAPVKIGFKALAAQPAAVSAADRVNAMADIYGRQITMNSLREMKGNQKTTITSSTSETTIVTADATYKLDLYGLIISNTSTTKTSVTIKDSTSGTTRFIIRVPADDTRGFMLPMDAGHLQAAANNNWTATCADSVASIEITALYVKNL